MGLFGIVWFCLRNRFSNNPKLFQTKPNKTKPFQTTSTMKNVPTFFCFLFLFFFGKDTFAQDTISLRNPSFDLGRATANAIPKGWKYCGGKHETPPDVHSAKTRHYGVDHAPYQGRNFVGLVVRSNFTRESIYQKLKQPIQKGKTYHLELYAAMADTFKSLDAVTMKEAWFTQPAIIRIWGIGEECRTKELLFESEPIDHINWKKIEIEFTPEMEHHRIMFEAFFDKMIDDPYNGNVLLDEISDIVEQ